MKNLRFLFILFYITGCTSNMKMEGIDTGFVQKIDYKNYQLGTPLRAYVGQEILSRKSYDTLVRDNQIEALNAFTLEGGIGTASISLAAALGDKFQIAGTNEVGNYVAYIPNSIFMFGVSPEGKWDKTVMSSSFWTSPIGSGIQYELEPENTTFKVVSSSAPLSDVGYINHELIFTGIGANGITILYREYTFENNARSAFTQELVYPVESKQIRFRNYLISIDTANSSELVYSIDSE